MMECDVFDHCPSRNCGCCPQWYKSYIQACKDKGIEATLMKSGKFCSLDITPTQGEDMTKKEAAKELGVSKATIDSYLSKGKLKGDGNGGVEDESVEEYKTKRDANLAAIKQKEEVQKNDIDQDGAQAIEAFKQAMQGKLDRTRPIKAETFVKAIEVAYQQGRADALKEIDQDEITIDEVLKDILPSVKAKYAQAS